MAFHREVNYDPYTDIVTVDGIEYAGEIFKFFAAEAKTGQLFRFVSRGRYDTVTLERIQGAVMIDENATPQEEEAKEDTALVAQPETPAAPVRLVKVVVRRAHLRVIKSYNANGKPIMKIYPRDGSAVSERVWFNCGSVVSVLADPVKGDGGGKWWQIVDTRHALPHPNDYHTTFLRFDNAKKV